MAKAFSLDRFGETNREGREITVKIKIKIKVRFVKLCASEGESPSRLAVKPLEFEGKTTNGKV